MKGFGLLLALLVFAGSALQGETVVATRTLRAQTVLTPGDLSVVDGTTAGTASDPMEVLGLETRVAIYAGTPLRLDLLRQPATVRRNQLLGLVYQSGSLVIRADGRALERGAPGDVIKVMNQSSKSVLRARILDSGEALVTP